MFVLVVRHAIAADKKKFRASGKPDSERPLTAEGRSKMKKNAAGLARLVPSIDILATSPLRRAKETADILRRKYKRAKLIELAELEPGHPPERLIAWLRRQRRRATVLLVGHEPSLGTFVSRFVGTQRNFFEFKKGGACLIDYEDDSRRRLLWLIQPAALRRLAK